MDFLNLSGFEATAKDYKEELLPVDDYAFEIEKVEMKQSKAGNNIINLQLKVTAGEHKNSRIWHVLNLWHSNPTVVDISKNALFNILSSLGIAREDQNFSSFEQLQNTLEGETVFARTKIQKSEQYGDKAVVHYFVNADDNFKKKLRDKIRAGKNVATVQKRTKPSNEIQSAISAAQNTFGAVTPDTKKYGGDDIPF